MVFLATSFSFLERTPYVLQEDGDIKMLGSFLFENGSAAALVRVTVCVVAER